MRKLLIVLTFSLPVFSHAGVWDETTPAGSAPISEGDDRIRELKEALGDALDWSGVFPGTNSATAPIFQWTMGYGLASARPTTNLQDGQVYVSTDSGVAEMYKSASTSWVNIGISSVTTGGFRISGDIISDGNITTTGDDVDISTHASFGGDVTITGALTLAGKSLVIASTASQTIAAGGSMAVFGTETSDTLSEFNGSTFTASASGNYRYCFSGHQYVSGGGDTFKTAFAAIAKNWTGTLTATSQYVAQDGYESTATAFQFLYFSACGAGPLTAGDTLTALAVADDTTGSDSSLMDKGFFYVEKIQ